MNIKQSPLVQAAEAAKRPTPWWLGWIVAVGVAIMGAQLVVQPLGSALGIAKGSVGAQIEELVTNLVTVGLLALWIVFKEGRKFSTVGFLGTRGPLRFLIGIGVGLLLFAIPTLTLLFSGQYRVADPGPRASGLAALPIVLALALVWVVQASTEEIVVRGYLLQIHGQQLPAWVAVVVTSLGFAVIHLDFTPLPLLNITLVAVFFAFVSLRQGSIWLASGIHMGWNYMQGNLAGIPVSGNTYQTSLVFLQPSPGSIDWLTGGTFGVEGSAAATVVLLIAAGWAYNDYRTHSANEGTRYAEPVDEPAA